MENPTYKQLQDFAAKTADLAVKKLGISEQDSDLVYHTVLSVIDFLSNYPEK